MIFIRFWVRNLLLIFWSLTYRIPPYNNLVCVGQKIIHTGEKNQILEEISIPLFFQKENKNKNDGPISTSK